MNPDVNISSSHEILWEFWCSQQKFIARHGLLPWVYGFSFIHAKFLKIFCQCLPPQFRRRRHSDAFLQAHRPLHTHPPPALAASPRQSRRRAAGTPRTADARDGLSAAREVPHIKFGILRRIWVSSLKCSSSFCDSSPGRGQGRQISLLSHVTIFLSIDEYFLENSAAFGSSICIMFWSVLVSCCTQQSVRMHSSAESLPHPYFGLYLLHRTWEFTTISLLLLQNLYTESTHDSTGSNLSFLIASSKFISVKILPPFYSFLQCCWFAYKQARKAFMLRMSIMCLKFHYVLSILWSAATTFVIATGPCLSQPWQAAAEQQQVWGLAMSSLHRRSHFSFRSKELLAMKPVFLLRQFIDELELMLD